MTQSVKFEEIKSSCSNLQTLASNIKTTTGNLNDVTTAISEPTWAGDAANSYRDHLQNLINKLPDAQHQMAMSVLFMASCADGYKILGENNVNTLIDLAGGQSYIDSINTNSLPNINLKDRLNPELNKQDDKTISYEEKSTSVRKTSSYSSSPGYLTGAAATTTAYGTLLGYTKSPVSPGTVTKIPKEIKQGGYTVTGYDYWIKSGKKIIWDSDTNQKNVADIWASQGSRFKHGMAVITVNGEERYLVAVAPKFGIAGDSIDVKLRDGTILKCVIADEKGEDAGSEWGHVLDNGKINILEFEVERQKYLDSGNPTTKTWGLEWDSSSPVNKIKNNGTIFEQDTTYAKEKAVNTTEVAETNEGNGMNG